MNNEHSDSGDEISEGSIPAGRDPSALRGSLSLMHRRQALARLATMAAVASLGTSASAMRMARDDGSGSDADDLNCAMQNPENPGTVLSDADCTPEILGGAAGEGRDADCGLASQSSIHSDSDCGLKGHLRKNQDSDCQPYTGATSDADCGNPFNKGHYNADSDCYGHEPGGSQDSDCGKRDGQGGRHIDGDEGVVPA